MVVGFFFCYKFWQVFFTSPACADWDADVFDDDSTSDATRQSFLPSSFVRRDISVRRVGGRARVDSRGVAMADDAARGVGGLNLDAAPFAPPPARAASVPTPNAERGPGSRVGPEPRRGRGGGRGARGGGGGNGGRNGGGRNADSGRGGAKPGPSAGKASSTSARDADPSSPRPGSTDASAAPSRGGKGVRADFLLNFHAPARDTEAARRGGSFGAQHGGGPFGRGGGGRGGGRGGASSGVASAQRGARAARRATYSKELFLQANFRFLVADWADLTGSSHDPDHMVDWDDVVLVEAGAAEPLQCPVCLDDPMTAPQVTLCGHAFCFPCVARHAVTNRKEGEPAKCPMCFQPLRLADLRGVRRRPIAPVVVRAEDEDEKKNEPKTKTKTRNPSLVRMSLVSRRRDSAVPIAAATTRAIAAAKGARKAAHPGETDERAAAAPSAKPFFWPRSDFAADGGACDAFAKYTLTSEERALGEEEMSVLEAKVHTMAAEGGADAEQELPYVLLACDAMQTRMTAWAERRAKKLGVDAPPPGVSGPARRDAMAAAARDVARRAAEAKAADAAFPGLPGGARAAREPSRRADARSAFLAGRAVRAARAFTDDEASEDEASDETEETSAGPRDTGDTDPDPEPPGDAEDSLVVAAEDSLRGDVSAPSSGEADGFPNRFPANASATASNSGRTETYYFYQSEDGQPVVMHSACLKLLLATFGSYDAMPASLEAAAVAAERHTQSEETRRRAAHLRHLPLTTEYTVVELDLSSLVGAEAMRLHGGELRARQKQRRKKLDAERREAAVAATAEIRERARARVFDAETRRNMPAPARATESRRGDGDDQDLLPVPSHGAARTDDDSTLTHMTPSEALARARAAADAEEALAAAEAAAAREAFERAEGPRGTSFARVAGLGFASGLDAPGLPEGGLEGDAFGPALAPGRGATAGTNVNWGPGAGRRGWGEGAEDALAAAAAAAAAEAPGKKKGKKKGVVLSLTSGGGRRY